MAESDEKFETKDLNCPHCGNINSVIITEQGQELSERYQSLLKHTRYRIIKKGAAFDCRHCGKKINAD